MSSVMMATTAILLLSRAWRSPRRVLSSNCCLLEDVHDASSLINCPCLCGNLGLKSVAGLKCLDQMPSI